MAAGICAAQSSEMNDADILGLKPGLGKTEALAAIKSRFPKARLTPTKRELALNGYSLFYDFQYKIEVEKDKLKPGTVQDTIVLTFLPNDEILGIRRTLRYTPDGQKGFDLYDALNAKYGFPVYRVSDDKSRFADQAMWSNTMLPGLSLVGTRYVQSGRIPTDDFGTVTPYPYCWSEMLAYTSETFDPKTLYLGLTSPSHVASDRAKQWKTCGKALWVANDHDKRMTFNLVQTEMILVDLARAPDRILDIPQMLQKNPNSIAAKPVEYVPSRGPTPQL